MIRRLFAVIVAAALVGLTITSAQKPESPIGVGDLKRWLTYLASDELEGRSTFSEGYGLASAYIADELKAMGVEPGGDSGTYFQRVSVLGVASTNRSSVTLTVNGKTATFENGKLLTFPANVGGKRTLVFKEVEFLGYGLDAPAIGHNDYAGKNVSGKLVVFLGTEPPKGLEVQGRRSPMSGRSRYAVQASAAAVIGPEIPRPSSPAQAGAPAAAGRGGAAAAGRAASGTAAIDFTTVQRLDSPVPPSITVNADGGDAFWEMLFSTAEVNYAELKARAAAREPLPRFTLKDVSMTIDIDAEYRVVQTQYSRNVVGVIPGSDPALADTYVAFGAHLDHTGYVQGDPAARGRAGGPGAAAPQPAGQIDRINNGADDDGSGSVALMAIAKAFMNGPRPKRSLMFVWFTGEERGLWGSRYHADYGPPPDKIVAQLNIDMIGRNQDDRADRANTVFVIGADRISTELHNINVEANESLARPLTLDYEFNDPADPNGFYFRSDHYSYAAKGIPAIFFTTGTHPDYHRPSDSVEKIEFEKMARITELVYETGLRVANLDHPVVRDNLGPRTGKGSSGKLPVKTPSRP